MIRLQITASEYADAIAARDGSGAHCRWYAGNVSRMADYGSAMGGICTDDPAACGPRRPGEREIGCACERREECRRRA